MGFARGLLDPEVLFVLSGSKGFPRGLLDPEVLFFVRNLGNSCNIPYFQISIKICRRVTVLFVDNFRSII